MSKNADKKEFLESYKWNRMRAQQLESEIMKCRLNELPGAVTLSGMPRGFGGGKDLSDYAARLDDLVRELYAMRDRMIEAMAAVSMAIDAVEDPRCALLLRYKYIQMDTWREIANAMGYSEDYVRRRLHAKALEMFTIP